MLKNWTLLFISPPSILSPLTVSHLFRELRHVLSLFFFFRIAEIAFESVTIYEYSERVVVWPTLYLHYLSDHSRLAFASKRNNFAQTATAGHGIHFNLMISDITRCVVHAKTFHRCAIRPRCSRITFIARLPSSRDHISAVQTIPCAVTNNKVSRHHFSNKLMIRVARGILRLPIARLKFTRDWKNLYALIAFAFLAISRKWYLQGYLLRQNGSLN